MATKAELERENKDLQLHIESLNADRGIFHTELGKLAIYHNFKPLLEFLNFTQEELNDLKELIDPAQTFELTFGIDLGKNFEAINILEETKNESENTEFEMTYQDETI